MTSQTYQTRHLTARDHQLIDALERDPRYRQVAQTLRPTQAPAKPVPKTAPRAAQDAPQPKPAPESPEPPEKPPTPAPEPAKGHPVGGMLSRDAPGLGRKGR